MGDCLCLSDRSLLSLLCLSHAYTGTPSFQGSVSPAVASLPLPSNAGLSVPSPSPRQDTPRTTASGDVAADPPSGRQKGAFSLGTPPPCAPRFAAPYSVFSEHCGIRFQLFCLQGYPQEPPSPSDFWGAPLLMLWCTCSIAPLRFLPHHTVLQLISSGGSECGNTVSRSAHS